MTGLGIGLLVSTMLVSKCGSRLVYFLIGIVAIRLLIVTTLVASKAGRTRLEVTAS